ncbi:MAG: hypothetical protein J6I40_07120, partial [Mailhella sp.]|nr:hypothetical protein [Mailhella sp.]
MSEYTVLQRRAEPGEVRIDRTEALRYMGYGKKRTGNEEKVLMESCEKELYAVLQPRCAWLVLPLSFPAPYTVDMGFGPVESVTLRRHLEGCHSAVLFAATVGIGVDMLVARYHRLQPSRAAVIDALGSSAIECWCDDMEEKLLGGTEHCSRFSPGYGDFSLECQEQFSRLLDMPRTAGIYLNRSLLMTPAKSVTAVIGIGA